MLNLRTRFLVSGPLPKPKVIRLGPRLAVSSLRTQPPRVTPIVDGAWLVRQPGAPGQQLELDRLGEQTWVLRARGKGSRAIRRIGPRRLGADLVIDRRSLRGNAGARELHMLRWLAVQHVVRVLRRLRVNVVLDVGANRGQYAQSLRRAGYRGRIVSFEPVPDIAEKLEKLAAGDFEWRVQRYALGETDDTTEINLGQGQGRFSSLLPATAFGRSWRPRITSGTTVPISVRRLDGLFDEAVAGVANPRVYLKLDTQGYDLRAFAGAGDRVADLVGMQSEVSQVPLYEGMPHLTEQLATYQAAGFSLTGMFPVVTDAATMRVIEFDAIMVRNQP